MLRFVCLAAIAVELIALVAFPSEARAQQGEKYDLKPGYAAGDNLRLEYRIVDQTVGQGPAIGDMSITSDLTLAVSVPPAKEGAESPTSLRFRRIVAQLSAPGMSRVADSEKPDSLLPGMPLNVLTQVEFQASRDAAGRITSVKGAEQFIQKAGMVPADEKEKSRLRESIAGGVRQLLEEPFAYLPDRLVGVMETWTIQRKVYGLPIFGAVKVTHEELTCRLDSVEKTAAGLIAAISVQGTCKYVEGAAPTDPPVLRKSGRIEYDFERGRLVSHNIELAGQGNLAMPEGQSVKFEKRIKITTTLTREAAPASSPAGAAEAQ